MSLQLRLRLGGRARQERCGAGCSLPPAPAVAPDHVSLLCRPCRYNPQKLTELILQFYGIRADMKRECKHARMSMKVFLAVRELDGLV